VTQLSCSSIFDFGRRRTRFCMNQRARSALWCMMDLPVQCDFGGCCGNILPARRDVAGGSIYFSESHPPSPGMSWPPLSLVLMGIRRLRRGKIRISFCSAAGDGAAGNAGMPSQAWLCVHASSVRVSVVLTMPLLELISLRRSSIVPSFTFALVGLSCHCSERS